MSDFMFSSVKPRFGGKSYRSENRFNLESSTTSNDQMSSLPRAKLLNVLPQLVCADCGTGNPTWASLNRGVLICGECSGVHRSLGRHISQIRSLKKGTWHSSQLALVHTLYNNGANNIWEHLLLDPYGTGKTGRKKPNEHDPVYPTKAEFIRAKYANLSFALRPSKDEGPLNLQDLNRQLWSCVRTSHVETTLRLLALGADPNYFDPEKGTSPMHIAAKEGQGLQVELLTIYGGDPSQPDFGGQSPGDTAKAEKHSDLAARFTELEFEATDRLTMYLCGRKPEHRSGQHFVVPEMATSLGSTVSETTNTTAKEAKRRLNKLSHSSYERLVQDVYDEVDRRETDAAWLASMNPQEASLVNERYIVPFLPVNPDFSSTRNQSRQKLAKFNAKEFANLIIDVLSEGKRRYSTVYRSSPDEEETRQTPDMENMVNANRKLGEKNTPDGDDVDPDYDAVPSESSFDMRNSPTKSVPEPQKEIPSSSKPVDPKNSNAEAGIGQARISSEKMSSSESKSGGSNKSRDSEDLLAMLQAQERESTGPLVTLEDYIDLRDQLGNSEQKVEQLSKSNDQILKQLSLLNSTVQSLIDENSDLRRKVHDRPERNKRAVSYEDQLDEEGSDKEDIWQRRPNQNGGNGFLAPNDVPRKANSASFPSSDSLENGISNGTDLKVQAALPANRPAGMSVSMTVESSSSNSSNPRNNRFYTPPYSSLQKQTTPTTSAKLVDSTRFPSRSRESSANGSAAPPGRPVMGTRGITSPSSSDGPTSLYSRPGPVSGQPKKFPETVVQSTEELTRQIQGLLFDAQGGRHHAFASHAAGIQGTVDKMVTLVNAESRPSGGQVEECLNQMVDSCISLTVQCSKDVVVGQKEQLSCQVVQAAYDVAKSAKQLMNLLQS